MNDKEKKKLAKIPEPKPEKEEMKATLSLVTDEQVNKMQDSIVKLADSVSTYLQENKELLKSIDKGILDSIEENTDILAKTTDAIEAMAIVNNKDQIAVQEKSIAEITKAMAKIDKLDLSKVTITNPTDTSDLAKSKDFVKLEKAIVQVSQRVNDLTETLKPNQAPEEFIPYRRVVKRGNGFVFDDNDYSRGGGGGSSSSSSGQTQIVDGSGNAVTVTGNKLDVNATVTSSGGAILDGVDNTIKSTVFDYVSSNPVAVRLTDTNGDYIAAGAGTQYTEDVASAADPIGTQLIARRRDSLATETTTDGDNTAVNSTAKGELYVKHTDAIPVTDNSGSLTVDDGGTTISVDDGAGSLTVDGSVTANAGTNLNTSALALETGGNLATVATNTGSTATNTSNTATNTTNIPNVVGTAAAAIPSKLLQVGGSDGTNARAIKTNASGQLDVRPLTTSDAITTTASVVGGGTEATAQRVTIASDSTGVLSVDDNGSSLTVDGTVAASNLPTTVDTNSGNKSASTLRVVLATDQPQLTNKLLVTPDANSAVNLAQLAGNTISSGVGSSGTGTLRVVGANNEGKTIVSKGGSASSSGDNTLVAAGTNKLKVFSYTFTTTSTTALTVKITDGASGTVLWQALLQAPTSVNVGATATVTPPSYLFATSSATALVMNLSSANAVHYSLSYYDEA